MSKCRKCGVVKPDDSFFIRKIRIDTALKEERLLTCKECLKNVRCGKCKNCKKNEKVILDGNKMINTKRKKMRDVLDSLGIKYNDKVKGYDFVCECGLKIKLDEEVLWTGKTLRGSYICEKTRLSLLVRERCRMNAPGRILRISYDVKEGMYENIIKKVLKSKKRVIMTHIDQYEEMMSLSTTIKCEICGEPLNRECVRGRPRKRCKKCVKLVKKRSVRKGMISRHNCPKIRVNVEKI